MTSRSKLCKLTNKTVIFYHNNREPAPGKKGLKAFQTKPCVCLCMCLHGKITENKAKRPQNPTRRIKNASIIDSAKKVLVQWPQRGIVGNHKNIVTDFCSEMPNEAFTYNDVHWIR